MCIWVVCFIPCEISRRSVSLKRSRATNLRKVDGGRVRRRPGWRFLFYIIYLLHTRPRGWFRQVEHKGKCGENKQNTQKKVCVTCAATPRWAQRADDALCCLLAALIGRWRHELHSVTANAFAIDFKFVGLTSCGNRTPL